MQTENQRENISEENELLPDTENRDISNIKKIRLWARKMIEENNVEPDEISRESKKTRNKSCYTALVTELTKFEPSTIEEALSCQAWKDAMV